MTVPFPLDGCDTKQRYHQSPHGSQYSSLEHSLDSTWSQKSSSISALTRKRRLAPPQCPILPLCTSSIFRPNPLPVSERNAISSYHITRLTMWLWAMVLLHTLPFGTVEATLNNVAFWSFRTWSKAPKGRTTPCCHFGLP